MPEFMVRKGGLEVDRVEMARDTLTIGRDAGSDIIIEDERASRVHAIARWVGGKVQLVDNGSINGTFVNGERVAIQPLEDGDRIEIGSYTLLYVAEGTEPRSRIDGPSHFLDAVRRPPRDPNATSEIQLDELPHRKATRKRPSGERPAVSTPAGTPTRGQTGRHRERNTGRKTPLSTEVRAAFIGVCAALVVIAAFLVFFWLGSGR